MHSAMNLAHRQYAYELSKKKYMPQNLLATKYDIPATSGTEMKNSKPETGCKYRRNRM